MLVAFTVNLKINVNLHFFCAQVVNKFRVTGSRFFYLFTFSLLFLLLSNLSSIQINNFQTRIRNFILARNNTRRRAKERSKSWEKRQSKKHFIGLPSKGFPSLFIVSNNLSYAENLIDEFLVLSLCVNISSKPSRHSTSH